MASTRRNYIQAYRLVSPKREFEALNGKGAALVGGRWNSEGIRMVYLSLHRSLSALETLVHLSTPATRSLRFRLLTVRVPADLIHDIRDSAQDRWWNGEHGIRTTQKLGDDWTRRQHSLGLYVPSFLIKKESNLLVNPLHDSAYNLKIEDTDDFFFDGRLFS